MRVPSKLCEWMRWFYRYNEVRVKEIMSLVTERTSSRWTFPRPGELRFDPL